MSSLELVGGTDAVNRGFRGKLRKKPIPEAAKWSRSAKKAGVNVNGA
jgi:hypothetical protein